MASLINKFFENLKEVINNFPRRLRRPKRGEIIIFFEDRHPLPWRRDPPQSPDTNANEAIL